MNRFLLITMHILTFIGFIETSYAQSKDDLELATFLKSTGDLHFSDGAIDSSNHYYCLAADMYKKLAQNKSNDCWENYIELQYYIAFNNIYLSNYIEAEQLLDSALILAKEKLGESHLQIANLYNGLGTIHQYYGKFTTSLDYYTSCRKIREKHLGNKSLQTANAYNNIGNIHKHLQNFDSSSLYYKKSLNIRISVFGKNHISVAESYNNIGILNLSESKFKQSIEQFNKSLAIREKILGKEHIIVAETFNNLAIAFHYMGEFEKAIDFLLKSLTIHIQKFEENHYSVATIYNNLGSTNELIGNMSEAISLYNKSLEIYRIILDKPSFEIAKAYMNLGNAYESSGDFNKAMENHNLALEELSKLNEPHGSDLANLHFNIGRLFLQKNDINNAQKYLNKSKAFYKTSFGTKNYDLAHVLKSLGDLYFKDNKFDKALKHYHRSIISNIHNFNDSLNIHSFPKNAEPLNWLLLLETLVAKNKIYNDTIHLKGIKQHEKNIFRLNNLLVCDSIITKERKKNISQKDRFNLGETSNNIYLQAIDVCLNLSNNDKLTNSESYKKLAFEFSEKNKADVLLRSINNANALAFSGIPDSLLNTERLLQKTIRNYNKLLAEQSDSISRVITINNLLDANRSYDSLNANLEKNFPRYYNLKYKANKTPIDFIQRELNKETCILSYIESSENITIFAICNQNFSTYQIKKICGFDEMIIEYTKCLANHHSNKDTLIKISTILYNQLLPSNLPKYIKNLIIIPHGNLNLIPFETLMDETTTPSSISLDSAKYLIKEYNISYAYSVNLFFQKPNIDSCTIDLVCIAPVFDDSIKKSFPYLGIVSEIPGTEAEVTNIETIYKTKKKSTKTLLRNEANEKIVKSNFMKNAAVLHFATHGIANTEKPELSGIILAQDSTSNEDGILHTGEIYNLELNADLTVLSACETGLGEIKKGEGLIGLSRALLYAGSKNIIVSLWKVADNSTSQLMVDFYDNLLQEENTQNYSEALRKAKLKMIAEGKYAHPFYWSPFILIGK